jgi:hypothetical protein
MLVGLPSDVLIVTRCLAQSKRSVQQKYGASGGRSTNNIIIADCGGLVNGRLSNVAQNFLFALVDDVLCVPDRNVKLLRRRFKTNAVKPPALEYSAVLFIEDVLLDQVLPLFS